MKALVNQSMELLESSRLLVGDGGAASTATSIFSFDGCSGYVAPTLVSLAGVTSPTNILVTTYSPAANAWRVVMPDPAYIINYSSLTGPALNIDKFSYIDFPGYQVSRNLEVVSQSSAYSAYYGEIVLVNASGGNVQITLPPPTQGAAPVTVKKIDSSTNAVLVYHNGTESIDGNASISIGTQYEAITVTSDGTNWYVINQVATTIL